MSLGARSTHTTDIETYIFVPALAYETRLRMSFDVRNRYIHSVRELVERNKAIYIV